MKANFTSCTNLLTYREQQRSSHLGEDWFRVLRVSRKRKLKSFALISLLSLLISIPVLLFFLPLPERIKLPLLWLDTALLLLVLVPLSLKSGWSRRNTFGGKVLHLDSLFALATLGVIASSISLRGAWSDSWSTWIEPVLILKISLFGAIWFSLRVLEAWWTQSSLPYREDSRAPDSGIDRPSLEKEELRLKLASGVFSFVVLAGLWFFQVIELQAEWLYAFLLPLGIPFHHWSISRFWHWAREMGVRLQNLNCLRQLGQVKHLTTHQLGVFMDSRLNFQESWYDPSTGWSEEELENIVYDLAHHSSHPICQSLQTNLLPRAQDSIDLSQVERLNHQGLRVHSRSPSGESLLIELGNLQDFILKTYDWSSEAKRRWQDWQGKKRLCCFLAINQRIVAGFSFEMEARPSHQEVFASAKDLGKKFCMISSTASESIQVSTKAFAEVRAGLVALERELTWFYWKERFSDFIELRGPWDPPNEKAKFAIEFVDREEDSSLQVAPVRIFRNHLKSLAWLMDSAEHREGRQLKLVLLVGGMSLGLSLVSVMTSFALPLVAASYALSFLFFSWKVQI